MCFGYDQAIGYRIREGYVGLCISGIPNDDFLAEDIREKLVET